MSKIGEPKKIARTSAGLRDVLFECIEKVRDGDMVAEDAKAIAGLAREVCATVDLEIQVARLEAETTDGAKRIKAVPLQLGVSGEAQK